MYQERWKASMARNDNKTALTTNRRRLLQAMGAAGAVGLAGCAGDDPGDDDEEVQEEVFQMLEEGFEEAGFEWPWEGEIITNEEEQRVQWAQIIQEEMNDTEYFDLELNQFEWTTYTGRVLAEDSVEDEALVCLGWSAGWDPDNYVYSLFHTDQATPACCNINHFSDSDIDELLDEGTRVLDIDERAAIYEEVQEDIVAASPMAFTRFGEEIDVFRTESVEGWETYPINSGQYLGVYSPWADVWAEVTDDNVGDDGELIGSLGADIANTDPTEINDTTSRMSTSLIYEGLMAVDFEGEPQMVLAEDLERVSDTEFVFDLREGVQFHPSDEFDFDGREMTADDVVYSMERFAGTTRVADVGDWLGTDEDGEFIGDVTAEDDYTVRIELPEPYAPFEFLVGVDIVPTEVGDGDLDLTEEPIGTGPYTFDQYDPDELWRVQRFDDYWYDGSGDAPETAPIETVTMRIIEEASAAEAAVRAGDVDLASNAPASSIAEFEEDDEFTVTRRIAGGFDFFSYPMNADTPFQNEKVRLATNRLIDREGIIAAVYDGIGIPAYAPVSPLAEAFTSEEFNERMGEEYSRFYQS